MGRESSDKRRIGKYWWVLLLLIAIVIIGNISFIPDNSEDGRYSNINEEDSNLNIESEIEIMRTTFIEDAIYAYEEVLASIDERRSIKKSVSEWNWYYAVAISEYPEYFTLGEDLIIDSLGSMMLEAEYIRIEYEKGEQPSLSKFNYYNSEVWDLISQLTSE